ncbi:hypothetical protein IEO21_05900 [Rhodonia placenta]|uniref:alcohol dehydrogenase n=1 Tax=Rhodonia placenta TaxID=104341 RepID=A0A8H7U1U1_9APHY|nr:hypothetical protein IEO21_05900 [Postia placenta]
MPSIIENVPLSTRAAVTRELGIRPDFTSEYPLKRPSDLAPGECIVKVEYTGVCHSDLHLMAGERDIKPGLPSVGGHEGVGRVLAIGMHTPNSAIKVGDRVGVKYAINTCMQCDLCLRGYEQHCISRTISGYDVDGTFTEYMVAFIQHLIPIPDTLSSAAAAPILCAGVTVYNALQQLSITPGSWLVIPGAGGGLGHLGIQYALCKGLRVIAIDSGDKREFCLSLGAEKFIDFVGSKDIVADVREICDGLGAHAALIVADSNMAYAQAAWYLRPQGTALCIGVTETVTLPMAHIVDMVCSGPELNKWASLIGLHIGNRQAVIEALALAARGKVRCHYVERPIEDISSVLEDMSKGKLIGRAVLIF